jgi:hypothetical protein
MPNRGLFRENSNGLSLFLNAPVSKGLRKGSQSVNQNYFVLCFDKIGTSRLFNSQQNACKN